MHGLLYLYILFRKRNIDIFGRIVCSEEKFNAGLVGRAGLVNVITWNIFSPVVMFFVAFNRRADSRQTYPPQTLAAVRLAFAALPLKIYFARQQDRQLRRLARLM